MKRILWTFFFSFILFSFSFGQGTVRGKITDETGETIIGVSIVLKSNRAVGSITDIDGNYSLTLHDSSAQVLLISFVGYKPIEETVHLSNSQVLIKNFVMTSSAHETKEVTVSAKAVKAKEYYTETIKKNSAITLDYVSSETMKKTGDVSVASAVTRVVGVSSNSSGFITIRGIGDRYIKTSINGLRIPTLDPFTNNIKLDIFPSSLVDNIMITKTASPDLPGDWTGAYLSVETKDYPESFSLNFETSVGYNNNSSLQDIISSQHSSTDWLGYDNGYREHTHTNFTQANLDPNPYQELVALGLGNYYNSLGITGWTGTNADDAYYKLGLVQLGLLPPALFNDSVAFLNAKNAYKAGPYKGQAFNSINKSAVQAGQSFPDDWNTITRSAPLDFSQSFSIGNQVNLFGKPLGFIAGFRYASTTLYDPDAIAQRPYAVTGLLQSSSEQRVSKEINGWSALVNLAYKFNPNNSISILFMPNLLGVNNARNSFDIINYTTTISQFYEDRRQLVYQFKSTHYLPGKKIKIESNASYTAGQSNAPDFKNLGYDTQSGTDAIKIDPTNQPADRYFRYLTDNLFDSRLSIEFPLSDKPGLSRKLKFGGAYQHEYQKNDQYSYHLNFGNSVPTFESESVDQILGLDNFGISNGTINWYYTEDELPINHTFGRSYVAAGFAMADYTITPVLRISGGLRIEKSYIYTDVDLYDSLGYPKDDIRRNYQAGHLSANPGQIDELSYLPSANVVYKIRNDETAPFNLRFNFSQTIGRPSMRELSDVSLFDYELQAPVTGNPDLKMVHISNYDTRAEYYFPNGDNASVSLFYKGFKNHIELEFSDSYYWQNVDKSHVAGIELEGKKKLSKHFDFRANLTFVKSTTTFVRTRIEAVGAANVTYYEDTVERPMFGQAPYILNGLLTYTSDSLGLSFNISYNVQGPRLVIGSNNPFIPDVYELQRHLVDLKAIKSFGKHFSVSATVRNVLNEPVRRSFKYPEGYTMDYEKYNYGTTYIVGILYKI